MAFVEEPVVCERWRSGGTAGALLRLLLAELGAVEEVYLGCDPGATVTFATHGFRPADRVLLQLDGARRGDQP